jgi:hypothetical protein
MVGTDGGSRIDRKWVGILVNEWADRGRSLYGLCSEKVKDFTSEMLRIHA